MAFPESSIPRELVCCPSTRYEYPFGAFAEFVDNAKDAGAGNIWIEYEAIKKEMKTVQLDLAQLSLQRAQLSTKDQENIVNSNNKERIQHLKAQVDQLVKKLANILKRDKEFVVLVGLNIRSSLFYLCKASFRKFIIKIRAIDVGEYVGHAILCTSCYKWRRVPPGEILDKRRSYQKIRHNWQCKDAIRGYDEEQKENIMVDCSDPAEDPLFRRPELRIHPEYVYLEGTELPALSEDEEEGGASPGKR